MSNPESGTKRSLTVIAALADGLIFLPVALTWFEIARAFHAYGRIAGAREDFLTEWQGGFRGSSSPISAVATRIALAVVFVAVLYTVLSYLERRGTVQVAVTETHDENIAQFGEAAAEYAREMKATLDRLPAIALTPSPVAGPDDGQRDVTGERGLVQLSEIREALRAIAVTTKQQTDVLKQIREALIEEQVQREGLEE